MFQTIISFINLIPPMFTRTVFKAKVKINLQTRHLISLCLLEFILSKMGVLKHIFTYATLVWPLSFKFQNMVPGIQMKDDGLQHIFINATFVWPPRWMSWKRKITTYPISIFMQSLIKFQSVVPEIQMKRAKRDILIYWPTK